MEGGLVVEGVGWNATVARMKSMTGFGRAEASSNGTTLRVEVASVNRKQGDVSVNLPRELSELEAGVRSAVAAKVSRGRVNVKVVLDRGGREATVTLKVNEDLAAEYLKVLEGFSGGLKGDVVAADLLRAPGVFTLEDSVVTAEEVKPLLDGALATALVAHDEMRMVEGVELKKDIAARLGTVRGLTDEVRELAPGVSERYRTNLVRRLEEAGLGIDLDDERVLKEVGIFAERCDISEELTRLESHLGQFGDFIERGEPVGREMDFLAQELNREVNTIGSKANNAEIAKRVVAMKAEVEKVREQVQNVE